MSEARQRNRRSGHEAEEWAQVVQRAYELTTQGVEWEAVVERLGLDSEEGENARKRVRDREAQELLPVECYGLLRFRGRYVPVRVAVAGADVEPLTGRTPQGALSTTGFALALGRLEQELRASARRALQGQQVEP